MVVNDLYQKEKSILEGWGFATTEFIKTKQLIPKANPQKEFQKLFLKMARVME